MGKYLYVTKAENNSISVLNTSANNIIATLNVGSNPWGVAVNPKGTKVYVTNSDSNNVSVIDTAINTVAATVSVGNPPCGIAVNSEGTKVYVANSGSNNVSIIDTATNKVTSSVSGGRLPVAFRQFIGPKLVLPVVNFSANVTNGSVPLTVQFNDSSENATERSWDFGDGTNSTAKNPFHTYVTARNYTVNLTASNVNGKSSKLTTIVVLKLTPIITWSNPADISYGTPLSSIHLNSLAPVPGNFIFSPAVGTILNGGIQTLRVVFTPTDNTNCTIASKNVSINVLPIAAFSSSPTSGKAPLKVIFTDKSTGSPNLWLWNFGDEGTSTRQNPTHTYNKIGTYTVSLTVRNAAGNNTKTTSNQVSVTKSKS